MRKVSKLRLWGDRLDTKDVLDPNFIVLCYPFNLLRIFKAALYVVIKIFSVRGDTKFVFLGIQQFSKLNLRYSPRSKQTAGIFSAADPDLNYFPGSESINLLVQKNFVESLQKS